MRFTPRMPTVSDLTHEVANELRSLKLFALFGSISFIAGVAMHAAIAALVDFAFGALPRMFHYHNEHPYPYLALVAVSFAFCATFWTFFFENSTGIKRWLSMAGALVLTVLLASAPGGVIWKLHDMQAGFFPEGEKFWSDLLWGAEAGLAVGWLVVLLSLPLNLLAGALGVFLLHKVPTYVRAKPKASKPHDIAERQLMRDRSPAP